jgi:hypothetical protein
MSRVMEVGMGAGKEGRRKEGVVMRLLRGESLDLLARETLPGAEATAPCGPGSIARSACARARQP